MNYYLIQVTHDVYCQGYEEVTEDFLVQAGSYESARLKVVGSLRNVKNCRNKTLPNEPRHSKLH